MDERKDELLQAMAAVELVPAQVNNEIAVQPYEQIPLSRLTALGVGLEPITAAVQQVLSHGQAASGIYKVTIPAGTHLAHFQNSTDYLGAALSNTNNAIQAQAHMTPLLCNPTMLFMAATLAGIDRKLDALQKTQQEMMDFLTQKEKSELRGDLIFLRKFSATTSTTGTMKNIRLRTTSKRWMFGKDAVNGWIFTGNRLKGIWENAVCSTAIRKFRSR